MPHPSQIFLALRQLVIQRSRFTEVLNWESVVHITGKVITVFF